MNGLHESTPHSNLVGCTGVERTWMLTSDACICTVLTSVARADDPVSASDRAAPMTAVNDGVDPVVMVTRAVQVVPDLHASVTMFPCSS